LLTRRGCRKQEGPVMKAFIDEKYGAPVRVEICRERDREQA
jgi:hypothetical protein